MAGGSASARWPAVAAPENSTKKKSLIPETAGRGSSWIPQATKPKGNYQLNGVSGLTDEVVPKNITGFGNVQQFLII